MRMKSMFKKSPHILEILNQSNSLFIIAILTIFAIISLNGTYYYSEMTLGLTCMSAFISYYVCKKIHWSVAILFFYCMASGLYITAGAFGYFNNLYLEKHVLTSLLILILHVVPFAFASDSLIRKMSLFIPCIAIVSMSIILFKLFTVGVRQGGIMNNSSVDPSLLAVCLGSSFSLLPKSFMKSKVMPCLFISFIFCILICKGSIGIGAMALCLFLMLITPINSDKIQPTVCDLAIGFSIIVFILKLAHLYLGQELFSDSTRFENFKIFYEFWIKNADYLFGTGMGTFWSIGPLLQLKAHPEMKDNFFRWLHSDWLQIIFELGFIGLALSLNVVYHFLRSCMRNKEYSIGVSGLTFCAVMVFNIPTKFFLFSFIGILILRMGFNKDGCKNI